MGKRNIPTLQCIDHNQPVSAETDSIFLGHLYNSLLLALLEQGLLTEIQYQSAAEHLKKQP